MIHKTDYDNAVYQPGAIVFAKDQPLIQLRVIKYLQRIYYCERVGNEASRQLAYFHRELSIV